MKEGRTVWNEFHDVNTKNAFDFKSLLIKLAFSSISALLVN